MTYDFTSTDLGPEIPISPEVPRHLDDMGGHEVLVIGDPEGYADFNHLQGDNPYGYKGTCGLVSCQDVLGQFGVDVTETDVVGYAIENGLCNSEGNEGDRGGTSVLQQAEILNDYGVPAHAETNGTLESLAANVEQGHGVIMEANAGVLWQDATYYDQGQPNHAVVVTGVVRDANSGEIQGFYINDSGTGKSAQFIDANTMHTAWEEAGGASVVTDASHTSYPTQQ